MDLFSIILKLFAFGILVTNVPECLSAECTEAVFRGCYRNLDSFPVIDFTETFPITDLNGAYTRCFGYKEGKDCLEHYNTNCSENIHMRAMNRVFPIVCDPLVYREFVKGLEECYADENLRTSMKTCKSTFVSSTKYGDFPIPKDTPDLCRFASDLIKCQTGIVDNYCDDTALNMHRNVTYERTAPLMEYLRCPEVHPTGRALTSACAGVPSLLLIVVCCYAFAGCQCCRDPSNPNNRFKMAYNQNQEKVEHAPQEEEDSNEGDDDNNDDDDNDAKNEKKKMWLIILICTASFLLIILVLVVCSFCCGKISKDRSNNRVWHSTY